MRLFAAVVIGILILEEIIPAECATCYPMRLGVRFFLRKDLLPTIGRDIIPAGSQNGIGSQKDWRERF
jgi:hypothetical protein